MKDMAKYIITVISDFLASKFAQYTIQKTVPGARDIDNQLGKRPKSVGCMVWKWRLIE